MPRTNLTDQFNASQRSEWKPKIVKRNTFRFQRDGETVIRLHKTDIVTKHSDGSVTLNSGGWKTVTTKDRMNDHLPGGAILYSDRGQWYIGKSYQDRYSSKTSVPYFDGIRVPQCFDHMPAKAAANEKRELKLRAQIKKLVAKCDALDKLPEPDSGDCWFCCLHDDKGKSWGEASGDNEHVLSHVKEGYLHGSLILNALKWAGYRDPSFIWHLENDRREKGEKPDFVKRALRRYLQRQCGLVS